MKSKGDSTDFYTAADDNLYYMDNARKYLDSVKIKNISKESHGVLVFKTNSGQLFKMRPDTLYWEVILFNGKSKPIIAGITNIQDDYKVYMKN